MTTQPNDAPVRLPHLEVNDQRWSIWMDGDTTMMELIATMGGLHLIGLDVEAIHVGDGVFCLRPMIDGTTPPNTFELLSCQSLGKRIGKDLPAVRFVR